MVDAKRDWEKLTGIGMVNREVEYTVEPNKKTSEPSDCVITPFLLKGSDRGDTVSTTEYTEKAREEHGTLMTTYLWLKIYAPRLASDFLPLASSYVTSVVRKVSLSSSNFQYHNRGRERRGRQARS